MKMSTKRPGIFRQLKPSVFFHEIEQRMSTQKRRTLHNLLIIWILQTVIKITLNILQGEI